MIWWTLSPHDPRAVFITFLIQRFSVSHITCILKCCVELSPTRKKLKKLNGLKHEAHVRVSLNLNYQMLICTITLYNMSKYKYCPRVTSAPRRHSRGPVWLCHMALGATSHPCGSRAKINLEKSLKIRKFITFKIQLQINPDVFHWI